MAPAHEAVADRARRFRWHLVAALAAFALLLVAQGGVAYAYFSTTATASGAGAVAAPVGLSVQAATSTGTLYPGTTGTVAFTVTNPNPFAVEVTAVTAASVSSSSTATCPATDVTVAEATPLTFPPFTIPARTTSGTESLGDLVRLAADAPSACQGAMFTIHIELSAVAAS